MATLSPSPISPGASASPQSSSGLTPAPIDSRSPSPTSSVAAASSSGTPRTVAPIIAAIGRRDPRDLALLSRIERELKRDPPATVHALIRSHEAGASRGQLLAELDQSIPKDLALRVLVRRWIDEVTQHGAPPIAPVSSGTHSPLVKPLELKKSP